MKHDTIKTAAMFLALSLAATLYQAPLLERPLNPYDEGIVLCGAARVNRGEVPYRDFWTSYGPGQFYALAGVFRLFAQSALVERLYDMVIRGLIAAATWWLLRGITSPLVALLGFGASCFWLQVFGNPGYPIYPWVMLSLLSLGTLRRGHELGSSTLALAAGLLAGLGALFRHDTGLLFIATATVVLLLLALQPVCFQRPIAVSVLHLLGPFAVAAALPVLAAYGALLIAAGPGPFVEQLVEFPLLVFPEYRALPYPSPSTLFPNHIDSLGGLRHHLVTRASFFAFPGLLVGVGIAALLRLFRNPVRATADHLLVLSTALGLVCVPQVTTRSDFPHLVPLALATIPAVYLFSSLLRRRPVVYTVFLLVVTAYLWTPHLHYRPFSGDNIVPLEEDLVDVSAYLRRAHADQPVYIGVENHDRLTINHPAIYFFAGADYATRYHELHPGVTTTRRVQEEMVGELSQRVVAAVVLYSDDDHEPNASSVDTEVNVLDRHIRSRFRTSRHIGNYRILTPAGELPTSDTLNGVGTGL